MRATAENIADRYGATRECCDAYAARSHQLAAKANNHGHRRLEPQPAHPALGGFAFAQAEPQPPDAGHLDRRTARLAVALGEMARHRLRTGHRASRSSLGWTMAVVSGSIATTDPIVLLHLVW
jgi:hypothetical protein